MIMFAPGLEPSLPYYRGLVGKLLLTNANCNGDDEMSACAFNTSRCITVRVASGKKNCMKCHKLSCSVIFAQSVEFGGCMLVDFPDRYCRECTAARLAAELHPDAD